MDVSKKRNVEATARCIGWAYHDLLWFSEEEAGEATRERDALLEAVSPWSASAYGGSKPHIGPLSPGCLSCGAGVWSCNFFTGVCGLDCFYCPSPQGDRERPPTTEGHEFSDPEEYVQYLRTFGFTGVGFSGGDPLLALDQLVTYVRAIRRAFGDAIYVWVYSNGQVVDREVLGDLERAGVDEIRFDIAAAGYDLAAPALAGGFSPAVSVEVPAIPEDLELLQSALGEMQAIGVDYLNVHQLMVTEHNYKVFRDRGYHFLHQPDIGVFESEIAALRLMRYVGERRLGLPVNYCSNAYKDRYQGRGGRRRFAAAVHRGFEEVTDAGYIRSFQVADSPAKTEAMVRRLDEAPGAAGRWSRDGASASLAIHSALIPYIDWESAEVTLRYLTPRIVLKDRTAGFAEGNLASGHETVFEHRGWTQASLDCWRLLYDAGADRKDAFRELYRAYPAAGKEGILKAREEVDRLESIAQWEQVETGLPEIY